MEKLSSEYWSNRYQKNDTGWDLKKITPPIKSYVDQLTDTSISILIPGAGKGYEAEYLHKLGFHNVHILDFSKEPINSFQERVPDFPSENLFVTDFFQHVGKYDLILEQTLYCAIDPSLRTKYAQKVNELLKTGGKLVGLLFDRDFESGPPFGGSKAEYMECFSPYFSHLKMEACYNSIEPRKGTELFIQLQK